MDSLESISGPSVVTDKHGRQYSLVMGDIAVIQSKVPVKEEHRPFIGLLDAMKFMSSAQGVDITLEQAAKKHDPQVSAAVIGSTLTEMERFELVDRLIAAFTGVDREETQEGGDQDQAPLADNNETGG